MCNCVMPCRPADGRAAKPEQMPVKDIETACARAQLQYHGSCTLNKWVSKGIAAYMTKKAGSKRKAQQDDDGDGDEQQAAEGSKTCVYLTIHGQVQRRGFRCVQATDIRHGCSNSTAA